MKLKEYTFVEISEPFVSDGYKEVVFKEKGSGQRRVALIPDKNSVEEIVEFLNNAPDEMTLNDFEDHFKEGQTV